MSKQFWRSFGPDFCITDVFGALLMFAAVVVVPALMVLRACGVINL